MVQDLIVPIPGSTAGIENGGILSGSNDRIDEIGGNRKFPVHGFREKVMRSCGVLKVGVRVREGR